MYEFKLPDLGEGIAEGQIVAIMVKEGDVVEEYQDILEVETDKAAVPIPSPRAGVIAEINVEEGQIVKVGEVMLSIDTGKSEGAGESKAKAAPAAVGAKVETPRAISVGGGPNGGAVAAPVAPAALRRSGPVPAAPVVRKLAREMNVDINLVPGSGPSGRIVREDVERFSMGHRGGSAVVRPSPVSDISIPAGELPDFSQWGPIRREQATQIRKTIARQMVKSWLNVPRVTHNDMADITEMENNRRRLNADMREGQPKMTLTAIVLKAVASALRDHPILNCSFDAEAGEIIHKDYVHIGVAVDTPRGLVVPVIRDVDKRSLPEVAVALNELAARAREAKFEIADLRGGTFTITNVGALGGTGSTPMINYPEVAILGLGKASQQPAIVDGQIVARRL
ncbi:MAG: 2-oxo acid dehydrogenase subunit E2, partial [Planctomycetes bacterium]|nr:2-oxo acid dehydrogenase subunit E2 [Planctomycetota bacterium]